MHVHIHIGMYVHTYILRYTYIHIYIYIYIHIFVFVPREQADLDTTDRRSQNSLREMRPSRTWGSGQEMVTALYKSSTPNSGSHTGLYTETCGASSDGMAILQGEQLMYIYICKYMNIYVHTYRLHVYIYITIIYIYICLDIYTYTHANIQYMYIYAHIYIDKHT